jgi:hypothetical protein
VGTIGCKRRGCGYSSGTVWGQICEDSTASGAFAATLLLLHVAGSQKPGLGFPDSSLGLIGSSQLAQISVAQDQTSCASVRGFARRSPG